ncbi:hypothetical protein [Rhizobium sp. HT1-10]|uniref:hypothetical protein n=1 Tax=Rhizobium sp. HT1-10 TaxID=3111638 RepID=UPI003C25D77F
MQFQRFDAVIKKKGEIKFSRQTKMVLVNYRVKDLDGRTSRPANDQLPGRFKRNRNKARQFEPLSGKIYGSVANFFTRSSFSSELQVAPSRHFSTSFRLSIYDDRHRIFIRWRSGPET